MSIAVYCNMVFAIVNKCALKYKVNGGNYQDSSMVSVEEDLGSHQLQRLVDLLTVHECEELLITLEDVFNQFNRLSEETNQFRLPSFIPRDTGIEIPSLIFNTNFFRHRFHSLVYRMKY